MVNEEIFSHSPFTIFRKMETNQQSHSSRSIFRNVLYGFSTWFLPLLLTFWATPIIIESLGTKDYGIFALVIGFIAYSFNLSFGRAIIKYVAEYRATGENEKIKTLISATFFINLLLAVFVILFIFLTANFFVADVFQIAAEDQEKTVHALYIGSMTLFLLILTQVFNSILQGIHRFDVYSKITNFNSLVIIFGNLVLAYSGYGLLVLLGWSFFITFVSFVLFIVAAKHYLPEFGISFHFPPETTRTVLKFSAGVIGHQILAHLFVLFERGWITRKLGVEALAFYAVAMSLAVYIHSFISSIVLSILPIVSELKDDRDKLLRLYSKANKIVAFLVVFIETTVLVHSRDFLTLWINADFAAQTDVLLIVHATTFSLLAIQTVTWQMTEGLGYPQFNTLIYGICSAVNVALILVLTDGYGNDGVALARLGGFAVMFCTLFYVEKWFFGNVQIKFWLRLVGFLGTAALLSAVVQKVSGYYLPLSWISLIASVGGGGIVYCLAIYFSGFVSAEEKLLVKNLFRGKSAA